MGDELSFDGFFHWQFKAPPPQKAWQWMEEHIFLGKGNAFEGKYRTDLTPWVRGMTDAWQDRNVTEWVSMTGRQCTKTQTLMGLVAYAIALDPGSTLWVMPAVDEAKTFSKRRLLPMLKGCAGIRGMMPSEREDDNILEQDFDTMTLYLTGSNAPSKLMSKPIRYLFLDEVEAYKRASSVQSDPVETARETTTTFWNKKISLSSTPRLKDGPIHIRFKAGDQNMFHVECPHCGFFQRLIWGKRDEPGGIRWDKNDTTCPGGAWNYDEMKKTVRYECASCQKGIAPDIGTRRKLNKTGKWVASNPTAPKHIKSFHISQLYPLWKDWGDLAEQFIKATIAADQGDVELLKAFMQFAMGEPWEERGGKAEESELMDRRGDYLMGQKWPHDDGVDCHTVFTVDVQKDHVWLCARVHKKGFGSGMIFYGRLPSLEDVREKQLEMGVQNRSVFVDARYRSQEVYEACLTYGWRPMIGEKDGEFTHRAVDASGKTQSVKRAWRAVKIDPHQGRNTQGRVTLIRFSWSNPTYKERVYLKRMKGMGGLVWQIPKDAPRNYVRQCQAEELRQKIETNGTLTHFWFQNSPDNHAGDTECMQEAAADMAGLSRVNLADAVELST